MNIAVREFHVNDIVFTKIRGHASWPSLILALSGSNATVQFYSKHKETYVVHFYLKSLNLLLFIEYHIIH